jgi:hypothetical protein
MIMGPADKRFCTDPDVILKTACMEIRDEIAKEKDVNDSESGYYKYAGCCDQSVAMLEEKLSIWRGFHLRYLHGEQRHRIQTDPKYWPRQHTWARIEFNGRTIYVDPTSSQFQHIYDDIPDVYISDEPPKWYYPDNENPVYKQKSFTRWLNQRIVIKHRAKGWKKPVSDGLIQFIQFEIWGNIVKLIRKIIYPGGSHAERRT